VGLLCDLKRDTLQLVDGTSRRFVWWKECAGTCQARGVRRIFLPAKLELDRQNNMKSDDYTG